MPAPEIASPTPLPPSLAQRALMVLQDARDLACDHLELAALEAQQAATSLIKAVCAVVVISILVVSAWLALVAAGIVWITTAGVSWGGALALGAVANLVVAAVMVVWIRAQSPELLFAATLRQLRQVSGDVAEELP